MYKYILKPDFLNADIITKTSDGTSILITAATFNDHFGEMMFKNGQQHLLTINPQWNENNSSEKKTFIQITDTHILLTSNPEPTENSSQSEIVKEQESKQKRGRRPKVQG